MHGLYLLGSDADHRAHRPFASSSALDSVPRSLSGLFTWEF